MFDSLRYDPDKMDKHFGACFYEERQMLDQITQTTSRLILATDTFGNSPHKEQHPKVGFSRTLTRGGPHEEIRSQAYARDKFTLTAAMRKDVCCLVELELAKPVGSYVGVVKEQVYRGADGVEHVYQGGRNQIHFNLPREDRSKAFKVLTKRMFK